MKLLIIDWKGKMGHFRKLDTNSSSLSYSFPARTTITGMIAGMIGLERDSYYELFSPGKCSIALSVRTPIRRIFQTVNYLWVKSKDEVNGMKGHTQIPIEFLMPAIGNDYIVYRIYFCHEDQHIYRKVKEYVQENKSIYPPCMGLSELLSSVEFIAEIEGKQHDPTHEKIQFHSVVRISEIKENSIELLPSSRFTKEFMTRSFNYKREIIETDNYIVEHRNELFGIPKVPYVTLHYENIRENIMFM